MAVALKPEHRPSNLSHLVVVDMVPKSVRMGASFRNYLQKMKEINEQHVKTVSEADQMLATIEPVRACALFNSRSSIETRLTLLFA